MYEINLLPWRAELRKQQTKQMVLIILLSLTLSFVLGLMTHLILSQRLYAAEKQCKKKLPATVIQKNRVEEIKQHQRLIMSLLNDLGTASSFHVVLTYVVFNNNTVLIQGNAGKTEDILLFQEIFQHRSYCRNVQLAGINQNSQKRLNFSIKILLKSIPL